MRQGCTNTVNGTIMNWQLFLATYVYWYAEGRQSLRDDSGRFLEHGKIPASLSMIRRFNFIGALQALLDKPPPLPTFQWTRNSRHGWRRKKYLALLPLCLDICSKTGHSSIPNVS